MNTEPHRIFIIERLKIQLSSRRQTLIVDPKLDCNSQIAQGCAEETQQLHCSSNLIQILPYKINFTSHRNGAYFMKLNPTLALAAATATGLLSATSAYGFNLKTDRQDLFDTFNSRVRQESLRLDDASASMLQLDPETLRWTGGADSVDVFFINEGAWYRNQLLFSANGEDAQMIFDDIASTESIMNEDQADLDRYQRELDSLTKTRSDLEQSVATRVASLKAQKAQLEQNKANTPSNQWWVLNRYNRDLDKVNEELNWLASATEQDVADKITSLTNTINWKTDFLNREKTLGNNGLGAMSLGDGVSLGTFEGETSLNFMIRANGARNPNGHIFGAQAALNGDELQHVIAYEYEYFNQLTNENENWVLMGFEDIWGVHKDEGGSSDRDFNDVVIAVRGVTGEAMVSVPEPSSTAAVLGLAALGMTGLRKSKKEV